ncbi:MAG: class II aldolase/adducin family protein, partial [Spirochaetia bacterium]|nr:class II aldolase/adducin family protein [Spirochaetia bacterium]
NLTPKLKLSIETEMHRLILVAREDCKAIVHAHPTYVSAFSAMQKNNTCAINTKLIAESFYILEEPVLVPYRLMGTEGLAQQAAFASYEHDVLVLENHGAVALGRSMLEAFDKMELLERAAQMTVIVKTMEDESCKVSELDDSRLKQLMHMKYGK